MKRIYLFKLRSRLFAVNFSLCRTFVIILYSPKKVFEHVLIQHDQSILLYWTDLGQPVDYYHDHRFLSKFSEKFFPHREQADRPNITYYVMRATLIQMNYKPFHLCYVISMFAVHDQSVYQRQLIMHICQRIEQRSICRKTTIGKFSF